MIRRIFLWQLPVSFVGCFLLALYTDYEIYSFLLSGGMLSLFGASLVISSYIQVIPWRRHPSSLVLQRTVTNLLFSFIIVFESITSMYSTDSNAVINGRLCRGLSFLTQISLFAGEAYLFSVSVDLATSLTNPFSSYKINVRRYHIFAWLGAIISGLVLLGDGSKCQGLIFESSSICWINGSDTNITTLWQYRCFVGFFLSWVVLFYATALLVLYYAWIRLSNGLEITYAARQVIMSDTNRVVICYAVFYFTIAILYVVLINTNSDGKFYNTFLFLFVYSIACRGYLDAAVWFFLHNVNGLKEGKNTPAQLSSKSAVINTPPHADNVSFTTLHEDSNQVNSSPLLQGLLDNKESGMESIGESFDLKKGTKETSETTFLGISDELEPQLNKALRQEVLSFVTVGIKESVKKWMERLHRSAKVFVEDTMSEAIANENFTTYRQTSTEGKPSRANSDNNGSNFARHIHSNKLKSRFLSAIIGHQVGEYGEDFVDTDICSDLGGLTQLDVAPEEIIFDLDESHRFRDFRPLSFHTLRHLSGVSNEWYIEQFAQKAKEQVTEGASNAFLFFCGELVVKTVTREEANTLLRILDSYRDHLKANPDSLLVRIFGLHSLTFYGHEFTFVVMRNIFPEGSVNERYDIKGSWVGRNASLPSPGTRITCRHCVELFVVGGSERCPEIVGFHEANVVFKDNDLISKIRLQPHDAFTVLETLNKDSDALCAMGITDYSLLVGIKNQQYDVEFSGSSVDKGAERVHTGKYPARSVTAPCEYYLGIVDILQTWSVPKRLERFVRVQLQLKDPEGVSCMSPEPYKVRFQRKMSQVIEHSHFVREVTGNVSIMQLFDNAFYSIYHFIDIFTMPSYQYAGSWRGKREVSSFVSLVPGNPNLLKFECS